MRSSANRLRQRRVVDLLRAGPRRGLALRPDAGRLRSSPASSCLLHRRLLTPRLRRWLPRGRRPRRASRATRSTSSSRSSRLGADAHYVSPVANLVVLRAALIAASSGGWDTARFAPGDSCAPPAVIVLLSHQRLGRQEVGGLNIVLRSSLLHAGCLMVVVCAIRVFVRRRSPNNIISASRRPGGTSSARSRWGDAPTTGIETISNMAEEPRTSGTIPRRARACARPYTPILTSRCRRSRCPRCRDVQLPDRRSTRRCSRDGGTAAFAATRSSASSSSCTSASSSSRRSSTSACSPSTPPHRDRTPGSRRVAPVYLMGPPPRARPMRHCIRSTAPLIGILVFGIIACVTLLPGQPSSSSYM